MLLEHKVFLVVLFTKVILEQLVIKELREQLGQGSKVLLDQLEYLVLLVPYQMTFHTLNLILTA